MHWLPTTHVRRYQRHYDTSGHIWQGRFKSFPVQDDDHPRVLPRYIERNPWRAGLVDRAELWPWSSLRTLRDPAAPIRLDPGPAPRGADWIDAVNAPMFETEVAAIRECLRRGRPLGDATRTQATAQALDLQHTLNRRGHPPNPSTNDS